MFSLRFPFLFVRPSSIITILNHPSSTIFIHFNPSSSIFILNTSSSASIPLPPLFFSFQWTMNAVVLYMVVFNPSSPLFFRFPVNNERCSPLCGCIGRIGRSGRRKKTRWLWLRRRLRIPWLRIRRLQRRTWRRLEWRIPEQLVWQWWRLVRRIQVSSERPHD